MFIQQDCGCIGLLIENQLGSKTFYKILDCRSDRNDLYLHDDSNSMEYHRYRQLNDDEVNGVIHQMNQAMADGDRFENVQLSLGIEGSHSQSKRQEVRSNWDRVCRENNIYKAYMDRDAIKRFPLDDRNQDEIDKETERLKRLDEFDRKNS